MITIHNIKDHPRIKLKLKDGWVSETNKKIHVYCGRKCDGLPASPLQNPYKIDSFMSRERVIQCFRSLLWDELNAENSDIKDAFNRLCDYVADGKDLALYCWCHPAPCHCEIIKNAVEWKVSVSG